MNSSFFRYSHLKLYGVVCFALLCTFSLLFPLSIYAQSIPAGISGLVIESSSPNPYPGQEVTITLKSYSIDIDSSTVSWSINGKAVQSGVGMKTVKVIAPELGKSLVVSITARPTIGTSMSDSITITASSIDMLIETDGYTHPLFLGKISPRYQNIVKIIAIPHLATASGVEYDPKTLVYTWKKGGTVLQNQSGYGKQSIYLAGDIVPRPYDVTVSVAARDSAAQGQGSISVAATSPSIGFYVTDPLYGTFFNKAVKNTVRIGSEKETSVLAVPFGFNKPADDIGSLALTWLINSVKRTELSSSQSVVLRAPEGSAGTSNIRLDIRNNDKILQGASGGFSASFSGDATIGNEVTF